MFLRICRGTHDAIYECSEVRVTPQERRGELLITIEQLGTPDGRSVIVDKNTPQALGIYVMNSNGRTVETLFRKDADEPL